MTTCWESKKFLVDRENTRPRDRQAHIPGPGPGHPWIKMILMNLVILVNLVILLNLVNMVNRVNLVNLVILVKLVNLVILENLLNLVILAIKVILMKSKLSILILVSKITSWRHRYRIRDLRASRPLCPRCRHLPCQGRHLLKLQNYHSYLSNC